ncbi:MAG: HlyD family efflux transporter periplasmic adaptor subunit [Kiritimatiellaeota bacterium]|nr:HlyD family efflux transporter periplasmic adaptor subunit [Kiritimatiellota bacterium]
MSKRKNGYKKFIVIGGGAVVAIVLAVVFWTRKPNDETVPTAKVKEGPLSISVTSSGSIQSRDKVILTSELEGNNTVIWVVDEGVRVAAGDLLLEFNSSDLLEKHKEQEIVVANAETAVIVTDERLGIVKGDCEAALLDAEVEQKLAKMEQEKYDEGDYPQQLRQFVADIALAEEEVERATEKLAGSQRLAEANFLTRTELQADELERKRKDINLEMARTKLDVLTNYTVHQQQAALEGRMRRADRALARVAWQNKATLRQVESELRARNREFERATNRLSELNFQISKSKIYAPTNGIILYASTVQISRRQWWVRPLAVGGMAVQRQELIYIPLDSGMVVEVMIPEASLTKIGVGMPAKVKIDAFPGRVFNGQLVKIAILPDGQSAQLNPDLKLYKCEIECDFKELTIRPGMSCDVELIKETYEKALYIPVQCVVREEGKPVVYLNSGARWEPRVVEVGFDNNRMIHILDGLRPGEEVMLAPPIKEKGGKPTPEDEQEKEEAVKQEGEEKQKPLEEKVEKQDEKKEEKEEKETKDELLPAIVTPVETAKDATAL